MRTSDNRVSSAGARSELATAGLATVASDKGPH